MELFLQCLVLIVTLFISQVSKVVDIHLYQPCSQHGLLSAALWKDEIMTQTFKMERARARARVCVCVCVCVCVSLISMQYLRSLLLKFKSLSFLKLGLVSHNIYSISRLEPKSPFINIYWKAINHVLILEDLFLCLINKYI